jgi:hypothetical protein
MPWLMVFMAVLFAFSGLIFYLVSQNEKRWKELAREIALVHGCHSREITERNARRDLNVYEWPSDGLRVILGGGSSRVEYGALGTKAAKGLVMVVYPKRLPFKLSIRQGRCRVTGDPDFDQHCLVETDNLLQARRILENASLRAAIRTMVPSMIRKVRINEELVYAMFYDKKEFKDGVDKTIELAKLIYHRASGMAD